jgi:hypothetical protein
MNEPAGEQKLVCPSCGHSVRPIEYSNGLLLCDEPCYCHCNAEIVKSGVSS